MKQKDEENTTTFYSRIMEIYRLADFPVASQFLIVDKLIHGCSNTDCKRKLMGKGKDVTVKECLDLLRQYEAVNATMKHISTNQVNATYSLDPSKRSQRNGSRQKPKHKPQDNVKKPCPYCSGDAHRREDCPAKNAKCAFCKKNGHFEKACIFKKKLSQNGSQNAIVETSESDDDYEQTFDIGHVYIKGVHGKGREVLAYVEFPGQSPSIIQGKVDTGAMMTCMPLSLMKNIGYKKEDLETSRIRLRGVTGTDMKTCGKLSIKVTCNHINDTVDIIVTELGSELILGLDFCKRFKLISIADSCIQRKITVENEIHAVHIIEESAVDYTSLKQKWDKHLPLGKKSGDPLQDLKSIFPEMFDGTVGLFEGEVDLKLTEDAKPVQLPPRAVALSYLPKLKQDLDKMEEQGIIRPCPEVTEWVHNLVLTVKSNGDLRICLDPKNLNKYLVRSVHYTASWEDVQHSFKNGNFFSTLDVKSGYWTKTLSRESQLLTASNTPFTKYRSKDCHLVFQFLQKYSVKRLIAL